MSDEHEPKSFSSEFAIAATRATSKLGNELRLTIEELKTAAPALVKEALAIERKAAQYLWDGISGKIAPEIAKEAALREHEALEFLALRTKELAVQATIRKLKRILDVGVEVGLALVKVAIGAAV